GDKTRSNARPSTTVGTINGARNKPARADLPGKSNLSITKATDTSINRSTIAIMMPTIRLTLKPSISDELPSNSPYHRIENPSRGRFNEDPLLKERIAMMNNGDSRNRYSAINTNL